MRGRYSSEKVRSNLDLTDPVHMHYSDTAETYSASRNI